MKVMNFVLGLVFATAIGLFIPQTVFCQTEKLGTIGYTPPKGWNKTDKENIVAFSKVDPATGGFCIITLYGATPGTGKPETDFKREWANLVVKNMKAEPNPETENTIESGWTATAGGSPVDSEAGKAFAMLTVISGGGRTVSILGVFNDQSFMPQLAAFSDSIVLGKAVAERPTQPVERSVPSASAAATMHAADLVGQFENNEIRAIPQYVGKRIRIHGIVNIIEINRAGQIVVTFKSSITTSGMARCYFDKSQSDRVGALNANEEATVEGTVKGLGDGFEGSKAYVVLLNCVVP